MLTDVAPDEQPGFALVHLEPERPASFIPPIVRISQHRTVCTGGSFLYGNIQHVQPFRHSVFGFLQTDLIERDECLFQKRLLRRQQTPYLILNRKRHGRKLTQQRERLIDVRIPRINHPASKSLVTEEQEGKVTVNFGPRFVVDVCFGDECACARQTVNGN